MSDFLKQMSTLSAERAATARGKMRSAEFDKPVDLELVLGVSLGWGMPHWSETAARLPRAVAQTTLEVLDWCARRLPTLADVIVLAGRPRHSFTTSA